jgi:hypothetical protein
MVFGQDDSSRIITKMLADSQMEEDLEELCDNIGGRVTGSKANELAIEWAYQKFIEAGIDVSKHEFEMPSLWLEEATTCTIYGVEEFKADMVSKYHSPPGKYSASLVYVGYGGADHFEQNKSKIKNNFVLVDADLCLDIDGLFSEYTNAYNVELLAKKYQALGIIFTSSRPRGLLYSFIGSETFENQYPQFVMSRESAQRCARLLEKGDEIKVEVEVKAEVDDNYNTFNVIGEIKGSKYPNEVVLISAHLDSWALGTGANDNGCNVAMIIDIARQMKALGIQSDRTIRFVLWNGEEQGYFGSWAYNKDFQDQLSDHVMMLSIDIGSGDIIGFFTNGREELIPMLDEMLLSVKGLGNYLNIPNPIIGTDNFDFMLEGVPNLVANHKPATYGINYHASSDTFDKVDLTALNRNSAIIAHIALSFANMKADQKLKRHNKSEIEKIVKDFNLEFSMRMFNVFEIWLNGNRGLK